MATQLSKSLVVMEEKSGNLLNKHESPTTVPPGLSVEVSRKSGRLNQKFSSDTQPSGFLDSTHVVNSQTIQNVCKNKRDSMEEMSGNTETCLPETTGDQGIPVVVRRKPGRPPKRKKISSDTQPARPMDCNVPVNSKAIYGLNWPHNTDSVSNELTTTNTSFTTLIEGQSVTVRRKPGRPPKQKNKRIAGAVKQDWTSSAPYKKEMHSSPICIPNQNDRKYLVNSADSLTVISTTQSQTTCHSHSVSERDNGAEGLKGKRGRPKKQRPTIACKKTVDSFASSPVAEADGACSKSPTNHIISNISKKRGHKTKRLFSTASPKKRRIRQHERNIIQQKASFLKQGHGNYHKMVDQTEVKSEFPSSIDPTNKHRASTEHIQPITSSDPNKSHHNTLECSRYGRKRSLKLHFKIFKLEQGDESEYSSDDRPIKRKREKRFKCKECDRSYKFRSQYILHERSHTGEKPFHCHVCGKRFGKNSNLNLHLKNQHKSYKNCSNCNKRIHCSKYSDHVQKKCKNLNSDSNMVSQQFQADDCVIGNNVGANGFHQSVASKKRKANVCQYCGKKFAFHSALERHIHVHTGSKPHKCDVCGKGFCQQYFLCVHQLTHWSENRYNCLHCEKSFTEYLKAKNHVCSSVKSERGSRIPGRSKVSLSYTCDICKNTFFILKDFHIHVKGHSSAKLYHCLMCGKLFSFPSEYNAHRYYCKKRRAENKSAVKLSSSQRSKLLFTGPNSMTSVPASTSEGDNSSNMPLQSLQIHPKEIVVSNKPFHSTVIPQLCSRFVSKLNNLDNRSDPRKYLCPHCGRLFRHMGRLRAHMLTHAQGQSYTCGCCGKTLESWTKLWHHQRIHRQKRGRFTCPQCGQGFRFVEAYKRHMAGHPEFQWIQRKSKKMPLPYQCEVCYTSFETLDLLFSHQSCHFSGVRKVKHFHSSLDGHSPERTLSSSVNHYIPHSEPQCSNMDISLSPAVASLQESVTLKYPHQSFHSSHSVQPIDALHPRVVKHTVRDGTVGNFPTLKKKQLSLDAVRSEVCDGSPEDIRCVVCGSCYPAISELYLHYLQHARGQL